MALPSPRVERASDARARAALARVLRFAGVVVGVLLVIIGVVLSPLPGPGGLPVVVVGLMLVLRNSFKARRQFVRFAQAHPRVASPIRRLLRRDPKLLKIFWEQLLRMEKLILPPRLRVASRIRRSLFKRRTAKA
ncbi:MAG TPA: PGPGW domain-containing protein [Phenylobacterium sp.]|nr:PGPGW domain-containing protein [Phenylobacterium sp.]HQN49719.1 PGPGW domain-containing protein [Phenylobacterium sp.]HQP20557.1 PGPGW domain-containing protein [Phenylobacterium sp.]